jgi:hypothetical protein
MKSISSCSVLFSLSNETLLKIIGCKIAEKQRKYDLPSFLENWKQPSFWKSHISVKNDLFDLKIWLQGFLNMGYRMDIVRIKSKIFHVTLLWQNARSPHGPSLKAIEVTKSRFSKNSNPPSLCWNFENLYFVTSIALKLKINITTLLSVADYSYLDPFYSG